jgi:hypothetical protein
MNRYLQAAEAIANAAPLATGVAATMEGGEAPMLEDGEAELHSFHRSCHEARLIEAGVVPAGSGDDDVHDDDHQTMARFNHMLQKNGWFFFFQVCIVSALFVSAIYDDRPLPQTPEHHAFKDESGFCAPEGVLGEGPDGVRKMFNAGRELRWPCLKDACAAVAADALRELETHSSDSGE